MVLNDINSNRYWCTDKWYWMILLAIDIVYRQMVLNDINKQSMLCTDKWYWMILIAIDIVYRQMYNRDCVQTNGIEWH